ncbi:hypothetical protein HID58_075785, partial [Brassica napus]
INPTSVGDFDFGRIPREWSDEIEPFGPAPMTPELRGLIATLRSEGEIRSGAREKDALPDRHDESSEAGSLERAQKARRRPTLRSRTSNTSAGSVGDRALDDDVYSSMPTSSSREYQFSEFEFAELGASSAVAGSWRRYFLCRPECSIPEVQETSSWRFLYDNEAMEASNEYATLMEKQLADFPSKEQVGSHLLTIQQLRGELEAVRVMEQQRDVEIEGLKGKLAAA